VIMPDSHHRGTPHATAMDDLFGTHRSCTPVLTSLSDNAGRRTD